MNTYPTTKQKPFKEKKFDYIIKDEYRWLENIHMHEVEKWAQAQNTYTEVTISQQIQPGRILRDIQSYMTYESAGIPFFIDEYIFSISKKSTQNQKVLSYKRSDELHETILVDPNAINPEGTTSLDFWFVSPHAMYVAYGLSNNGSGISTLFIYDIKKQERLIDIIPYTKGCSLCWTEDEKSFFYTRYPNPSTVKSGDEQYYQKVFLHCIGTTYQHDAVIFDTAERTDVHTLFLHKEYLFITLLKDSMRSEIYVFHIKKQEILPLITHMKAFFSVKCENDAVYIRTNYTAMNYMILTSPVSEMFKPVSTWDICCKEAEVPLDDFWIAEECLVLLYTREESAQLTLVTPAGSLIQAIILPAKGTVSEGYVYDTTFYYQFESFFTPRMIRKYNIARKRDESENISSHFYSEERRVYKSADNTEIPLTLLYMKTTVLDGSNPAILYAYGAFGKSITPFYLGSLLNFLDKGGFIAIAHIRGGGEYGTMWHTAATGHKKIVSFYDLIFAADYLVKEKITNHNKLAITGIGAGGLAALEAIIQEPGICKAVICIDPILDMIHYQFLSTGARWIGEFGSSSSAEEIPALLSYSPYHNIREWAEYPSVLFVTREHNTHITPAHAFKMTALLQKVNTQNPVLLRVDKRMGEEGGNAGSLELKEQADILSFIYWQLEMF